MPNEELTWVVYNANMISKTMELIINLRGIKFYDDYVLVLSRECGNGARGKLYFDPNIFNLMGNGHG